MFNATRACELLVGLPDVNILDVVGPVVDRLGVTVESVVVDPVCAGCGERAWVKDRPVPAEPTRELRVRHWCRTRTVWRGSLGEYRTSHRGAVMFI